MGLVFCCSDSCKLERSFGEMVDRCALVNSAFQKEYIIQETLRIEWEKIFPSVVANKANNLRFLATKIERLLIAPLPPDISPKDFLVRYVKEIQSFLKTINRETSTIRFKQHFGLRRNVRVEEINLILQEEMDRIAFLIRVFNRSIVCFPSDYLQTTPILNDPFRAIIHIPLHEHGFEVVDGGGRYYRTLTDREVRVISREEAEMVDFQLVEIEVDRNHLMEKIRLIFIEHAQLPAQKREIVEQIKQDAVNYVHQAVDHVLYDLATDENFREVFRLSENEQIQRIEVLGQETHKAGKTPLLITFMDEKRIVYKPRSLKIEALICSNKFRSLFAVADLPTYAVMDKGSYGYMQYLENLKNENLFESEQQVDRYFSVFIQMDRVIQQLRGSDFHSENVVTRNRQPYLVDAEVVMGPTVRSSLLIDKDPEAAWVFREDTFNRIWVTQGFADECQLQINDGLPDRFDFYEIFNGKFDQLLSQIPSIDQIPEMQQRIRGAREYLSHFAHRIILIPSRELARFITMPADKGFQQFLEQLQSGLLECGLTFVEENFSLIEEQFNLDIEHNDVPIFYYHPQSKSCLYSKILIGQADSYNTI